MFVVNAFIALISLILISFFYFYLVSKNITSRAGDSRSGLFTALAEWSTKKPTELSPKREVRAWRPDLLIPVTMPKDIRAAYILIKSIVYPKGSLKILALRNESTTEQQRMEEFLPTVVEKFKKLNIPISFTMLDNTNFNNTINISMQSLNAAFFKPNIIFLTIDTALEEYAHYEELIADARKNNYAVLIYVPFGSASLATEQNIGLWLTNIPSDWKEVFRTGNNDLAILTAILMCRNWNGAIAVNIVTTTSATSFTGDGDVEAFMDMARFPRNSQVHLHTGTLEENIINSRTTDVNVVSLQEGRTTAQMIAIVQSTRISTVFCVDSEHENSLV